MNVPPHYSILMLLCSVLITELPHSFVKNSDFQYTAKLNNEITWGYGSSERHSYGTGYFWKFTLFLREIMSGLGVEIGFILCGEGTAEASKFKGTERMVLPEEWWSR